jgi:hypothetical protein
MITSRSSINVVRLVLVAAAVAVAACSVFRTSQRTFNTPEDAVKALVDAAKAEDLGEVVKLFGPDSKDLIDTSDPATAKRNREVFTIAAAERWQLTDQADGSKVLVVGNESWPFPIPLVKDGTSWRFDTEEGKEEILKRRIGRNELDVIQVCLAYVDAQREYYLRNPQRDALLQYAARFMSTPGKRDGLYWETTADEPTSPLGLFLVQARAEGYQHTASHPIAYHGYYYKILTGQGPNASGGAYDYVVRGKMIGGFAMVAYPAQYGLSGIMTFIVNHDGVVYQKDLGPDTTAMAQSITKFDPDETWEKL